MKNYYETSYKPLKWMCCNHYLKFHLQPKVAYMKNYPFSFKQSRNDLFSSVTSAENTLAFFEILSTNDQMSK